MNSLEYYLNNMDDLGDMTEKDRMYKKLAVAIYFYLNIITEDSAKAAVDKVIVAYCQTILQLHTTVPPVKKASDATR